MRLIYITFALLLGSLPAWAQSSTTGIISSSNGDLIILMNDDPSAPPYDAAILWEGIKGELLNKEVRTPSLELKCHTLLSEPQRTRFGSCSIEIKGAKVTKQRDGYGALINGDEAKQILSFFAGAESQMFPYSKEISLANGSLLISAAHSRGLFALRIKDDLMAH